VAGHTIPGAVAARQRGELDQAGLPPLDQDPQRLDPFTIHQWQGMVPSRLSVTAAAALPVGAPPVRPNRARIDPHREVD